MSLLEIRDLCVTFRGRAGELRAVSGVDFSVGAGEIVGLVGESGCGKTLTSLAVMGLLPERAEVTGEVCLDGTNLLSLAPDKMRLVRGKGVSMIFQEPMAALNPVLTIGAQLREALVRLDGVPAREADERAVRMLETVGVSGAAERMRAYPHQLSGGLCQRVMIAMALIREPKLLIADEPTTALDVTIQAQILRLIGELRDKTGAAVLLITHDLGVVAELCDTVCVMYAGRVMERASALDIFDEPLHPYTYGLMRSMPDADDSASAGSELWAIPGAAPALGEIPDGCPFGPRCSRARPECSRSVPPLVSLERGGRSREVRCFIYAGADAR